MTNELNATLKQLLTPSLLLLLVGGLMYFSVLYTQKEKLKQNNMLTPEITKELNKKGWVVFAVIVVLFLINIISFLFL